MTESYHTNLINVATSYLRELNIKVTKTSLTESLTENPFFPSLYSLSNTFDRFQVTNKAFKIDKENFEKLTPPFLAYVSHQTTGKDFVLVTSVTENEVQYIAENKKIKKIPKEDFLKNWQNIVLQAAPDDKSGEKDFLIKRKKEILKSNKTKALIASSVLIFAATIFFFLHSLPIPFIASASVLLIIKMFGLAATILLLIYEIDKSNAFVKSICAAGKQTNLAYRQAGCSAVLNSKASKILGMCWSEAGFFYFASTFLFLLFPTINFAAKTFVLAITNCIAAPYILFSVYYQWKVVKQWCPLCLTVQAVLFLELVWAVVNFWQHASAFSFEPSAFSLLPIAYCLLLPIVLWYIIKPLILKAKEEPLYKAAYKRLLYNPETFNHLLLQQPVAPEGYQNMGIEIGNPAAANTIIKVCNPFCQPCSKAHPVLEDIIHRNGGIKMKIIFSTTNDRDDKRNIVVKHLMAIAAQHKPTQTEHALDDWYLSEKKNYNAFANKYPLNGELKQQEEHLEQMKMWCDKAGITHTPTIFINGHKMPGTYNIEELKYIL